MQSHDRRTTRKARRAWVTILGSALLLATFAVGCRRTRLDPEPTPGATEQKSAAPQTVSFPTSDGGLIYAHEYGKSDHGVVLVHGGRFDKESWQEQAPVLARAGFRVLAIDLRGYGKSRGGSEPKDRDDGYYLDILGAVRYLRGTGAKTVSVVGASFGGGAAAKAAVEAAPGEIDRLILLAHSPIEQPERMKGRKLFITTRGDFSGGGVLRLPSIRDQYEKSAEPKELVILEGSAHAQHIFGTEQGERLMREIQRFLSEP